MLENLSEESDLAEFWRAALRTRNGLYIKTDNRRLLAQKLYRARADANEPELHELCITLPDDPQDQVWITWRRDSGKHPTSPKAGPSHNRINR